MNSKPTKPEKPRPDFPLFAHASQQWAKKINNRMYYFGVWADPAAAEALYNAQAADLHAGRKPRATPATAGGLTLLQLVNRFLHAKKQKVDAREMTQRTWDTYDEMAGRVLAAFGKDRLVSDLHPEDFAEYRARIAKKWGPVSIGNEVQRARSLFLWAYKSGLIEKPILFGPDFVRPSRKTMRVERASKPKRMFSAADLRSVIAAATQPLKAMILLGINCGFGNSDVGTLPLSAVDLEGGWVDFPRPKTGIERRCKLWEETVDAIREAIACRPEPKDKADAGLLFITKYGQPWARKTERHNPVSQEMRKLLLTLKLARPGHNYYAIRHTFETIGGESRDQVAVNHVMGHAPADTDMSSVYRERISDERLEEVVWYVHDWLFAEPEAPQDKPKAGEPRILRMQRA